MKAWMMAPLLLVGCASAQQSGDSVSGDREPYPVEAQTVTVHFLEPHDWREHTTGMMLEGSTWGRPGDVRGSATWETNEDGEIVGCEIFLPAGEAPSRELLAHELRHCREGNFHK